jgi:hypothetical protein
LDSNIAHRTSDFEFFIKLLRVAHTVRVPENPAPRSANSLIGVQLQDLLAVALGAAGEIGFRHFLSRYNSKLAIASN